MKKLLCLIGLVGSLYAQSCWNSWDKARIEEAELDGKIILSFKDAVTCEPISDANVTIAGENFQTDKKGELELPLPPDNIEVDVPLKVKKRGYIPLKQNIYVSVGTFWQKRFLMTEGMPINSARFVLAWGESPRDMDLHLISDDFHISYRNKSGDFNQANLDRDAMDGYGPETITLNHLQDNKTYQVYIHQYSHDSNIDRKVTLSVYTNNQLDRVVSMPETMSRCILVATIQNGDVTYNLKEVNENICKGRQ
jgi:hypothetical protein